MATKKATKTAKTSSKKAAAKKAPRTVTARASGSSKAAAANPLLPSMSLPQAELVDIGTRHAVSPLLALTDTVLAKLGSYAFADYGFDAKWSQATRQLAATVESQSTNVSDTKSAAIPTGTTLDAAVADAKDWRRRAATILSITPGLQGRAPRLASGSSVPQLIASLQAIVPLSKHASTARWGGGPALKSEGQKLLDALRKAASAHKTALGSLSPEIRTLNASKGALYEELRRLARVARQVAPPDDAALFAVSTHLRGRRRAKSGKKKTGGATKTTATTTTTTTTPT